MSTDVDGVINLRGSEPDCAPYLPLHAPAGPLIRDSDVPSERTTRIDQLVELEAALAERGVELWLATPPPRTLETARLLPRWEELSEAGRYQSTALSALRRHRIGRG